MSADYVFKLSPTSRITATLHGDDCATPQQMRDLAEAFTRLADVIDSIKAPRTVAAVDPQATDTGKPTTREEK